MGLLGALDPYKYKEIIAGNKEAIAKAASSEPKNSGDQASETGRLCILLCVCMKVVKVIIYTLFYFVMMLFIHFGVTIRVLTSSIRIPSFEQYQKPHF